MSSIEAGQTLWHLGALVKFHVTGKETGGRIWVAEHWAPRGYGPALHSHDREAELFVVLDGELSMSVADREQTVEPGRPGFGPRSTPHTFKVRSPTARFLVLGTPSGFEGWFARTGTPAPEPVLPPASLTADVERFIGSPDYTRSLREYGVEVLGPVLD